MEGRAGARVRQQAGAEVAAGTATPKRRPADTASGLALLQRRAGNRAVLALLGAQARLSVGSADDPLEREADRAASMVVAALRSPEVGPAAGGVTDEGGDGLRRAIRRAPAPVPMGADGGELGPDLEARLSSARSGGSPLPEGIRRNMETAFGADFSAVRVHEGPSAADLNRDLGATAFTLGRDIFFRGSAPNTANPDGQHLLAHELAHTVQQSAAAIRPRTTVQDL